MIEKLYTVEEVAELASVTGRTIRNYLKSGRLQGRKIGGQWRFPESEVQRLLTGGTITEEPDEPAEKNYPEPPASSYLDVEEEPAFDGAAYEEEEPPPPPRPSAYAAASQTPVETPAPTVGAISRGEYATPAPLPTAYPPSPQTRPASPVASPAPVVSDAPAANVSAYPPGEPGFAPAAPAASYPPAPAAPDPTSIPVQNAPAFPAEGAPVSGYPYPPQAAAPQSFAQPAFSPPQNTGVASYTPPAAYAPTGNIPVNNPPAPNPAFGAAPYPTPAPQPAYASTPPSGYFSSDSLDTLQAAAAALAEKVAAQSAATQAAATPAVPEFSDVGKRVARFVTEVHDCSAGPQICAVVDVHQAFSNAKIASERLSLVAEEESEGGVLCEVFVEYDERYFVARYTLFGTSMFLSRSLKLLG